MENSFSGVNTFEEEEEEKEEAKVIESLRLVLSPPFSLLAEDGSEGRQRTPNLLRRVLSLFSHLHIGFDLNSFELPPLFNMPKSQLQCYGESLYCIEEDYLSRCAKGKNSLERFVSVVAWSISTTRPAAFAQAPFNPILGETHHVSSASLNVLLEQVSHHPPVSALHATDAEENIELIWCHNPVPKYHGTSVEAVIHGKRLLKLLSFGENYEMDSPNLLMKILPNPGAVWCGDVRIQCRESGLEAEVSYCKSHSFLGFGGNSSSVKGKIFSEKTSKPIYEINGQWDRTVALKDVHNGEVRVLYDAKKAISKLRTPILKDPKVLPTESALVWGEVNKAILNQDWGRARDAKRDIEERERKLARERSLRGYTWTPKHFSIMRKKENEWECTPLEQSVPPAPIIIPT